MVKDTDEQSNEEIHRVRSRRSPSAGASVPGEVRVCHLSGWIVCQPGSSWNPFWDFIEASSYRHDGSLTPFFLFSRESGMRLQIPSS